MKLKWLVITIGFLLLIGIIHNTKYRTPSCKMIKKENSWFLQPKQNIYVNGVELRNTYELQIGDVIFNPTAILTYVDRDVLQVEGGKNTLLNLPKIKLPTSVLKEKYPIYRRTPRMIYDLPSERIDFALPERKAEHSNRGLWLIILPPIVMLIVVGVVMMVRSRGIFIIMSIAMFSMTIFTSTVQYFGYSDYSVEIQNRARRLK